MGQILELPEPIDRTLLDVARAEGVTPATWIAEKLPKPPSPPSAETRRAANERLRRLTVSHGRATGIDNEGIDADLGREYGDGRDGADARA